MKKIAAFLLCVLLLPCFALAEEPAQDLDALWARLADYKAELESERTSLNGDVEALSQDIKTLEMYINYYRSMQDAANDQLAALQAEQKTLDAMIAQVDELVKGEKSEEAVQQAQAILPPPNLTGKHYVQIDIADYGTITAELDADAAPITVTNFVSLVKAGFYDGLTFHRIIEGFMMQGGAGGYTRSIKGEFSQNGWNNPIKHERGVLSMARTTVPDSASSQFFIVHQAAHHLDGVYAAFGRVLTGIEVVDAICQNTPVTDANGSVAKANQPVITSIKLIEKPVTEAPEAAE